MTNETHQLRFSSSSVIVVLFLFMIYNKVSSNVERENSSKNAGRLYNISQKNEQPPTLESVFPYYIDANNLCGNMICSETYIAADYPYKQIMELVNRKHAMVGYKYSSRPILSKTNYDFQLKITASTPAEIYPTAYSGTVSAVPHLSNAYTCFEIYQPVYPIYGKGVDKKSYYIINVEGFTQRTDITLCHKRGDSCGDKSTDPEGYTYRCMQKQEQVVLAVFPAGKNLTIDSQTMTRFEVPSGCSCERVRIHENN